MLVEASEERFELVRQTPTLEPPSRNFTGLIDARNAIIALTPEILPELNQATIRIVSFDTLYSPGDIHTAFCPFPQFERDNWKFLNDRDEVLSERYHKYLSCLREVLKERPNDLLIIGSSGIRISGNPQLTIVAVSAPDYFYFQIRRKGPDLTVYINNQLNQLT